MIKRIQAAVKKSLRSSRMRKVVRNRNRHLIFQQLEERRVLAGYFNEIADEISGPSGVLAKASQGLDAISSVAKLPLINKKLEEVDKFNDSLNRFRTQLDTALRTLSPGTANDVLESTIVDLLGPGGVNVLANRAAPATIGVEDVIVDSGPNSVDIVMDLGITNESFNSSLGLGIDSVPLKPASSTNGEFHADVYYRNFRFGYNNTAGAYVDTSANNELELTLKGFLPDSFSAGLGFLNVRVTDQSPGTGLGAEDVTISLKANVTDTGISAPALGIDLDFQAHVAVQANFEGTPELATNFKLQWEIPAVSPDAPLDGAAWKPPILEFNDVTLSVGSFIKDLAQPIAKYVKDVIEPLEPIFNLLETRIPGISDVAETFGQSSITLVSLSQLLALSPNPPTQFIDAMRSAAKLRDLYTTVSSLADRNATGAIRLGNFRISGPGGNSLLNTSAALSNLGLPNWSDLVTSGGGLNLEQIKSQLRSELGDVGGEIADVLTKIASKAGPGAGDKAGFSFSFPIIENPANVALGMFLGRDENMVSVGLDINLELKRDIFIKIVPGVSIKIAPRASVNAATEIGYDTRGLREAMQPLYAGGSFNPNKLLNGLWISGNTHIDVSGSVGVGPVLGLPDIATVDVLGSVRLDVHSGLYNPSSSPKLRFFAGDFNEGKLFVLSGTGKADLSATVKVGGEIPGIGFVGFSKTWTFLETTFFSFSTDYVPMPGSMVDRPVIVPQLFDIVNVGDEKMLRLKAGPWAGGRGIGAGVTNEDFTVEFVRLGLNTPGSFPRVVPVIDVKAFGIVQRYRGQVDYILAQMGDGNDTVQVTDDDSNIIYIIHGDEGNDRINVDGNKSVYITGGDGNDTIDGGNGHAPSGSGLLFDGSAVIEGGNGRDVVTFGEGRLENLNPEADFSVFDTSTDFIRDRFLIDNERSKTDTEYRFQSNDAVGDLWIQPKTGGSPRYSFRFDATIGVDVRSGVGDDEFLGFPTKTSSLYGGYGNDVYRPVVGLDKLPTPNSGLAVENFVNFFGGAGTDSIIADDSHSSERRAYDFFSDNSSNLMNVLTWSEPPRVPGRIWYSGTEDFTLKSGSANDRVSISGVMTQGITVDSGLGNDNIVLGIHGFATIRAPMTINSGPGDDTFELQNVSNGFMDYITIQVVLPDGSIGYREVPIGNYTVPVDLEGGEGNNSLQIDDRDRRLSRPFDINQSNYQIEYDQFVARTTLLADDYATIRYDDIELQSLHLSDDPAGYNKVDIISLGDPNDDSPGDLVTFNIHGYEALDRFTLFPHDDQGNASLLRPIALDGGSNIDQMVINDTNSAQPMTYTFGGDNTSFLQNIAGITPSPMGYSTNIRRVELYAGSENDRINLDYAGFIQTLALSGGPGDDELIVSPNKKDLASAIGLGTSLAIDGGEGRNGIKLFNENNPFPWEYGRNGTEFNVRSPIQSFSSTSTIAGIQTWELFGGSADESFTVDTVGSGETMSFQGNLGQDSIVLGGYNGTVAGIAGQVIFDAGVDGGQARVWNHLDSRNTIAHIAGLTDTLLGAAEGDTLFAPGGSLRISNLRNHPIFTGATTSYGLYVGLGSGNDAIFTEAQPNYSIQLSGGNPTSAPGDSLHLSLASLQSPVITDGLFGVSTLTSSNRKSVQWSGFESLDTAYVAPRQFVVTNTLDSGPGSLRQAILDANAAPNVGGADVIRFAIPGVGAHSIKPLSALPFITDPVVLDGTSQPGYSGKPIIELDGSLAGRSNGLVIRSGGTTVRGFAINRFAELSSLAILGAGGNVIQSNYLGTNLAGDGKFALPAPTVFGIALGSSDNNIIGTDGDGVNDSAEGNVISGHGGAGILIEEAILGQFPDNNVIAGNRIGTSADGNIALDNGRMGVWVLSSGTGNRIGTNADGISDVEERNIISGNSETGVYLGGTGFSVAGNYIGANAAGTAAIPNGIGVRIERSDNNRVGGTVAGMANLIAYNHQVGVSIENGRRNSVLGNSIFGNGELGIDLHAAGDPSSRITPNDSMDVDTGSNDFQNFPVIESAFSSASNLLTVVKGRLPSKPQSTYRIEFFASQTVDTFGYGEGQRLLGAISATTDANGFASFVTSFSTVVSPGQFISSTATDDLGNTSEFGASVQVVPASSLANVFTYTISTISQPIVVTSPVGTTLEATAPTSPGVAPPAGVMFPFGFLDFRVRGIAPGAAADVTITGLNASQITDYYKYGATPANRTAHWYNFLFGQSTDSDNAVGTGMEIANGSVILHLIDGRRGDDDLLSNGIISDIGGAVFNLRPVAIDDVVRTNTNTPLTISVLANDSDSDGTLTRASVVVVAAASHGTTSVNPTTGAITYKPATNFTGPDSFIYQVRDNLGAVSNAATVSILVDTPPVAANDTATTLKNFPVVVPVLGNDRDTDGTINASSVTIVGQVSHGTTSVNAATGAITYTPASNYFGPDSFTYKVKDNLGVFSNVATVSINVVPTGTISGKEFLDVTGNGLTTDDLPLSGVKVFLDTNNNGVWNSGEPTSISQPDGIFKFTDLIAGNYKVRQVTPTGYVRTAPTTSDLVSVAVTAGQDAGGNSFANAALGNLNALSNVVYVINGMTAVSDLRGKAGEGDVVQVSFTIAAGTQPQRFTLVSYTAPGKDFDPNTASQQQIFDVDTGVFGPGTYTLTVSNPHSYFQVDFVNGFAIDRFGPDGSNITYSAQNRLASADNGGKQSVRTSPASLTGTAYLDANNNGVFDTNERPIAGVTVSLTGSTTQTVVTDSYGAYTFDNLPAGTFTITETQPGDYADGSDALGNKGGTKSNDKFSLITLAAGAKGIGYNFGELQSVGPAFSGNQTQSTAWWNGSNGQALIKALNGGQNSKNLGNWLATNFKNLFGSDAGGSNDLTGKTNAQVATYYQSLYSSNAKKIDVGVLALALAVYVTKSNLAGNTGTSYGFAVSTDGLGSATVNVGASGAAFGMNNNTVVTIAELLSRTNARARKGLIWDTDNKGSSSAAENILRDQAGRLFNSINNT